MLENKKLFLFDIDGTIAVDSTLYEGSFELIEYISSIGGKSIYITNNSTKSRKDYVEKFSHWNIETSEDCFVTASYATSLYLQENFKNEKIFVCGTKSLVEELRNDGLMVTEEIEDNITCLVVGFDNEFTYEKSVKVCEILYTKQVHFIATNPDLSCPTKFGFIPDCGAICKMIECATFRVPEYIGKPNKNIVDICLKQTGFSKEETIVVGDRLYTDIACGINAGVDTSVVFTGEAKEKDLKDTKYPPTYSFENIKQLYDSIEK